MRYSLPKFGKEMSSFWEQTVRPNWLFRVEFPDVNGLSNLNDHMVASVKLPVINTTEEKYIKNSKLYPEFFNVYDFSAGITFEITFVENLKSHVEKAKWSYYRSLITATEEDKGGIFYAPPISDARHIDGGKGIIVELLDYVGEPDIRFIFKKCTLASVDGINLGYSEGDKIMPSFTFKAKQISTYFRE